jgi:hypothetical protein
VKAFIADDRRLQTVQSLLKSPGLICLKKPRIEQREADIGQRKDAHDKEETPAPTDPHIILR